MSETLKEGQIESESKRDELTGQVNSAILKLFFKEKMKDSAEAGEGSEQEVNVNVHGSIKGPDMFGNYIVSGDDGKKRLVDEHINNITGLVFSGIMPYNDRYYIGDVGKKCVFFDTQTGNVVEFTEVGNECKPKIYGKDEVCNDEFLIDLCKKSTQLYPNMSKESLLIGLQDFLQKSYLSIVLKKDIDEELRAKEAVSWTRESLSIMQFLMGAYEYMYNGEITKYLAGKNGVLWRKLAESEVLKETYPDLYLAMRELDFLKNVFLDEKGNVRGSVVVHNGICSYIQVDGTVSQYEDIVGPDPYGSIITTKGGKKYFINSAFQFPFFGFDNVVGPDVNGNYILDTKGRQCFVIGAEGKMFSLDDSPAKGGEPRVLKERFDSVTGPDMNNNYLVKATKGTFLVNSKGEVITPLNYLKLELHPETGQYEALLIGNTKILGADGGVIRSEKPEK